MVVLGIVLLAGAAAMITGVALSQTGPSDATLWSLSVSDISLEKAFAAGLITAVIGCMGTLMLVRGLRRDSRRRRERRTLAVEYERLARQVETTETVPVHEDDSFDADGASAHEALTADVVEAGEPVEYNRPVEYSKAEYGQLEYGKQSWPTA